MTTLPDGRIVYSSVEDTGALTAIDPATGNKQVLGSTGVRINALGTDRLGNIYAATSNFKVFVFDLNQGVTVFATGLPFDRASAISDLDIAEDGTVYVAGYARVVALDRAGNSRTIAEGLHYEPVWVDVAPHGAVYINESSFGLQRYDPESGRLVRAIPGYFPFGDIVALSENEILYFEKDILFKHNVTTGAVAALYSKMGRSYAFAVNSRNTAHLGTPGKVSLLNAHIVTIQADGTTTHRPEIAYGQIASMEFDKDDRLCLATDQGFKRVEPNNSITNIRAYLPLRRMAVGANGLWYIAQTAPDSLAVRRFDEFGTAPVTLFTLDKAAFGTDVFRMADASIDIEPGGTIVFIATAVGSQSQGPFLQRVYRANADGSDLKVIANLDSGRVGGMVDIAVAPAGDIFVLTVQGNTGGSDVIYRIDKNNNSATKFVDVCGGNDPMSIDVDPTSGDLWICTTQGVFRVSRN